jgi:hypothetical protein
MLRVLINGEEAQLDTSNVPRFSDLIELVKATIDPDHMITSILMDGREVTDDEWFRNLSQLGSATVEINTGRPDEYVSNRISEASKVVRSCFLEFRDARKGFQDGDMQIGNRRLKVAVDTLRAFFEWYGTLLQLIPEDRRDRVDISPQVRDISETCKKICQQQLYQSWWALGESIEKDLEPKLDKLEDACRKAAKQIQEVSVTTM